MVEQAVLIASGDSLEADLVRQLLAERPQRVNPITVPSVPILIGTKVAEAERILARRTLAAYGGDRGRAASALGIDVSRLAQLIEEAS
jgi:DNA-binding NtrC family response regulator